MTLDSSRLQAIRDREAKATKGPWNIIHRYPMMLGHSGDLEFLAHARQDIADLLAALTAAEQARLEAVEAQEVVDKTCPHCQNPNPTGGIISDDLRRTLICHECCERIADYRGRRRAIKRAEAAESRIAALEGERDTLRGERDQLKQENQELLERFKGSDSESLGSYMLGRD